MFCEMLSCLALQVANPPAPPELEFAKMTVAAKVAEAFAATFPFESKYECAVWFAQADGTSNTKTKPDSVTKHRVVVGPQGWLVGDDTMASDTRCEGNEGWEIDYRERIASVSTPVRDVHDLVSRIFHQSEAFGSPTNYPSLSQEVKESFPVEFRSANGRDILKYRVPKHEDLRRKFAIGQGHDPAEMKAWTFQVEVTHDEPPRIVAFEITFEDATDKSIGKGVRVSVERWQRVDGVQVPDVVRQSAWGPPGRSEELYSRNSILRLTPEEAKRAIHFEPPRPGWRLADPRVRLIMKVGSRDIFLDGRKIRLKEPLLSLPGDRLPELLKTAETPGPQPERK